MPEDSKQGNRRKIKVVFKNVPVTVSNATV